MSRHDARLRLEGANERLTAARDALARLRGSWVAATDPSALCRALARVEKAEQAHASAMALVAALA